MPLYEFNGKQPRISEGTWIAPSAEIIGDVTIGRNCYIGFSAIIRGDFGTIEIGDQSLIEEGVVIHCLEKVSIGNRVIVGHQAMLHETILQDNTLVGMQAMLCDYSVVEEWSIVAEKSLVLKQQTIPSGKIYGGSPAKEIGDVTAKHRDRFNLGIDAYFELTGQYHTTFRSLG